MSVKVFIGTSISPDLAERISPQAKLLVCSAGWRWSPIVQWHITSLFIGQRDETELQDLSLAMERCCKHHGPITLNDGKLIAMPEERPTMLWVRFTPSAELLALHQALANATSTPPSPYDPLWPHITLARGTGALPALSAPVLIPSLTLDQLSLFRSDPGPDGTIHTALDTKVLGQGIADTCA